MVLLGLIVVLAGTPLRLSEAASDLARSLEETGDGWNIEEIDGGVGDDSGATIRADVAHAQDTTEATDVPPAWLGPVLAQPVLIARFTDDPPARSPANSSRRCALLQCFQC